MNTRNFCKTFLKRRETAKITQSFERTRVAYELLKFYLLVTLYSAQTYLNYLRAFILYFTICKNSIANVYNFIHACVCIAYKTRYR